MSLQEKLNEFSRKSAADTGRIGGDARQVMTDFGAELVSRNLEAAVPGPGAQMPDATLTAADGTDIALSGLWAKGPLAVLVYRGMW